MTIRTDDRNVLAFLKWIENQGHEEIPYEVEHFLYAVQDSVVR